MPCSSMCVRRTTSVAVRPSRIATVRWTCEATAWSCVTTTTVAPRSRLAARSASKTSSPVAESSSPVGSSAKITSGLLARAVAIATRCCSPPES